MAYSFDRYDVDKFEEGAWEDFQGGRFKIARMGNPRYRDTMRQLEKRYRKLHGDDLTAEQQDEMHAEGMATALLTGWEGIIKRGDGGEPVEVPYSAESAKALLLRDPKLVAFVAAKSADLERFENEDVEDQTKKQSPPSPTS